METKEEKQKKGEDNEIKGKVEMSHNQWYFPLSVIILSIIIFLVNPVSFEPSLQFFLSILEKIIPIIFLVFVLMFLVNLLISPKQLVKYLGKESKSKLGWPVAVITGIISTGPIYMWYPLLSDLQTKGVRNAFIATFLYNRSIKPALIPLIIFYFGINFTIVLTIVMIIASIFQGLLVEKILRTGGNKK
jgi:uncharacterized membrane protein YraQ (UPF0718 family)